MLCTLAAASQTRRGILQFGVGVCALQAQAGLHSPASTLRQQSAGASRSRSMRSSTGDGRGSFSSCTLLVEFYVIDPYLR